jgi:hypothetical protein
MRMLDAAPSHIIDTVLNVEPLTDSESRAIGATSIAILQPCLHLGTRWKNPEKPLGRRLTLMNAD